MDFRKAYPIADVEKSFSILSQSLQPYHSITVMFSKEKRLYY